MDRSRWMSLLIAPLYVVVDIFVLVPPLKSSASRMVRGEIV
jgi:hypothetical protein